MLADTAVRYQALSLVNHVVPRTAAGLGGKVMPWGEEGQRRRLPGVAKSLGADQ